MEENREEQENGGGENENNPNNSSSETNQDLSGLQNSISGTTQAVEETNNFLQDTTVDDTQFDMPTVEVNDPTANFFDTMFTGIYNSVTTDEDKTIILPILGSNISVNSADFNVLQASEWSLLRVILSAMWTIGIGLYILKDIRKMIEKIKDGNIENVTNDDIKADIV